MLSQPPEITLYELLNDETPLSTDAEGQHSRNTKNKNPNMSHPSPTSYGQLPLGWVLTCVLILTGMTQSWGQCTNTVSLLHYETPCGSGLNTGQSFTAPATGMLDSLRLSRCTGVDSKVVIRAFNGTDADWNQGAVLGESESILPGTSDEDACFISGGNGFSNYAAGLFTFNNLALEQNQQYIIELIQGAAASNCNLPYSGGNAFSSNGAKLGEDLAFDLFVCPGSFEFGCTNAEACNYDPEATANDGSCTTEDCAGTCGGSAFFDTVCGCVNDISEAGQCLGCTDAGACNFDASSTVDDGSCYYPNCDGLCPEILDFYELPCGTGLNYGQSFTAPTTGYLNSITLARCTGVDTQVLVRQYNGNGATWNQGSLIGEADQIVQGTNNPEDCFISGGNGFSNYEETTFTFSNMGLEAGTQYVLQLVQGVAATGCSIEYSEGTAFAINGSKPNEDLVFSLSICPIILNFGCTNIDACNYNPDANVEDGSCLMLDCQGTCGGSAYLDPACGCLGSIAEAGSCLGCTDSTACNFEPSATANDGSCQFPDCNGDCGGNAIESECGCIGGSTGIPATACIGGCLTQVTASSSEGCAPGILYGQSITADQNGQLKRVRLKTCCALDAQCVIRRAANTDPCTVGGPEAWNSGEILGYSNLNESVCSGLGQCVTGFGTEGYIWRDFNFADLPIQAGAEYVIELISGVAIANCDGEYVGGNAFNAAGALPEKDLVFSLHVCNQNQNWGCTDPTSCSYDSAADNDDGSCLYEDCEGICGGEAHDAGPCGCIGGTTGIREEQCVNGDIRPIIANDGLVCTGALTGQTFLAESNGFISEFSFFGLPNLSHSIEIRRSNGPDSGQLIFSGNWTAEVSECDNVQSRWLSIPTGEVPIQEGSEYVVDFIQGYAQRTCSANYHSGYGIQNETPDLESDMAFRLVYRNPAAGELIWGCSQSEFCNFSPDATHDDGTCTVEDCNGDCGGSAYNIEGCGCVEGLTGIEASSCYGCLDETKCNYAPEASIEDGSCAIYDCNGDCGGTAVVNTRCGCVGGNTGIDPAICLDKCQSDPFVSNYAEEFQVMEFGYAGSGQTFTATNSAFLTASRFRQSAEPTQPLTFELRALDGPSPAEGTLLVSESMDLWTQQDQESGDVFIEWDLPVLLNAGSQYAIVVKGNSTNLLQGNSDSYTGGSSFSNADDEATGTDFYFELFTCTDVYGCTDAVSCSYDVWATIDDESCTYPEFGFDCDGIACTPDLDGDGICAELDSDDNNPFVCIDTDIDGCDDCLSGIFNPAADGPDDDGDGICNASDMCSDTTADNYNDPQNEVCRGTCDTAPIFNGIELIAEPSTPYSEDGIVVLDTDRGGLPFVPPSAFDAVQLVMEAAGMAESMTIDLNDGPIHVHPGLYRTMVYNSEGCPGVAAAPGGTTYGQLPVSHLILIGYTLCCECGVYDFDTDGICDDVDECTDKGSPNYNDPNNIPCD